MPTTLNKSALLRFVRSNYLSGGPACVDIELTSRCNLRCPMCWLHGQAGVGDRYGASEMTTSDVMRLIDQVKRHRPRVYFGGAEPLVRPDFVALVRHARESDLPVAFTTNATLLGREMADDLVELGVDQINVSLDGSEEMHDEIRGRGNFQEATSNLRYLLQARRARGARRPIVAVNLTVNPLVAGHMREAVKNIQDETGGEADLLTIHHLWFVTSTELKAHQQVVERALHRSASGAASHCLSFAKTIDSAALADEISGLEDLERLQSFPALQGTGVLDFYSEGYRSGRRCVAPFHAVVIKPNGDAVFCPDEWIDDYVLGNVCKEPFDNIWFGSEARRFRSILFRRRSFPACQRCSWMHCPW
jgi:radical SAM protein with 4Fe4S-binding SPASM domain